MRYLVNVWKTAPPLNTQHQDLPRVGVNNTSNVDRWIIPCEPRPRHVSQAIKKVCDVWPETKPDLVRLYTSSQFNLEMPIIHCYRGTACQIIGIQCNKWSISKLAQLAQGLLSCTGRYFMHNGSGRRVENMHWVSRAKGSYLSSQDSAGHLRPLFCILLIIHMQNPNPAPFICTINVI
jgi:hypothetical protein